MTVTYELGNSLYLNITNRCSNSCTFCVRNNSSSLAGFNLWLEKEPTVAEVIADVQKREISKYKELVFCGYGEPMMRSNDLLEICQRLKANYHIPIRLNTNGQANLINGSDITPQLKGLIDSVSISLNAADKQTYQALCLSDFGEIAFEEILNFAFKCKNYVPKVVFSVVDLLSAEEIKACNRLADNLGIELRVRHFIS